MFYLVNEVNFITYLNYFYKLNLKSPSSINLVKEDKKGIRRRLCFTSSQLQAERSLSPLVSLLINLYLKANFKLSLTRKNWLLKFGFAYLLAQILEPKLLVHEILKFTWSFFVIKRMRCISTIACTLNVRGDWGI